jgi:peptidoglycan/LPS O-acetylase OafA/YrhL
MPTGRLPALDGLRGVAILMVFGYHLALFGGWTAGTAVDRAVAGLLLLGWIGVDLFFVLSGFLITGILLDTRGRPGWLKRFYLRRILRIVPPYYAALAVQLAVLAVLGQLDRARPGWTASWFTNHFLAREGWDALATSMHHYWSLAVEEQYYLLWPALAALLPRGALRWTAALLILGASVTRVILAQRGMEVGAYVLLPARMDGLAVGALLAIAVRGPGGLAAAARGIRIPAAISVPILGAILLVRGELRYGDPFMLSFGLNALMVVCGGALLLSLAPGAGRWPTRWLESRSLVLLGTYSYALYLWHQPVILVLTGLGLTAVTLPPVLGSRLPGMLLLTLVAGALTAGLALLSWRLVEGPALGLKDRVAG